MVETHLSPFSFIRPLPCLEHASRPEPSTFSSFLVLSRAIMLSSTYHLRLPPYTNTKTRRIIPLRFLPALNSGLRDKSMAQTAGRPTGRGAGDLRSYLPTVSCCTGAFKEFRSCHWFELNWADGSTAQPLVLVSDGSRPKPHSP